MVGMIYTIDSTPEELEAVGVDGELNGERVVKLDEYGDGYWLMYHQFMLIGSLFGWFQHTILYVETSQKTNIVKLLKFIWVHILFWLGCLFCWMSALTSKLYSYFMWKSGDLQENGS